MKQKIFKFLPFLFAVLSIASIFSGDTSSAATLAVFGGAVGRMEREAFDNFDPEMLNFDPETVMGYDDEDGYDVEDEGYDLPDTFTPNRRKSSSVRKARAMSALAQLDIVIDNQAISARTTIELFNYLRSNTMIRNAQYNTTTFEPQTFDKTFLRATPASGQLLSDANLIYWRSDGSLVYNTTVGTAANLGTASCVISCPQVPFRVLHEATRNNLLFIEKVRLSVKTAAQIDESIGYFKNSFMGGISQNDIAPRAEFKPNQFQNLIVDVPMKVVIDAERGFRYTLISQERVTMTLFFKFGRGNASGSQSLV